MVFWELDEVIIKIVMKTISAVCSVFTWCPPNAILSTWHVLTLPNSLWDRYFVVLEEARGRLSNRLQINELGCEPRPSGITAPHFTVSCHYCPPHCLLYGHSAVCVLVSSSRSHKGAPGPSTKWSMQQIFVTVLPVVPTVTSDGAAC